MIELDGSFGEGGGQMLRTALALSSITGEPFEAHSIRKGRCDPGLKAQHISCIRALEELTGGRSENVLIGSERISFFPGKIKSQTLSVNIGTAGSVTLMLQSLLLPAMFAPGKVRLRLTGGTDVPWSEPYDYFREVLIPRISRFSEKFECSLEKRGYYPRGGGKVDISITPKFSLSDFRDFELFRRKTMGSGNHFDLTKRGELLIIRGTSHASSDLQKQEVAERQARSARSVLSSLNCPVKIDVSYSGSDSTGSGICLWALFANERGEIDSKEPAIVAGDSLGEKRKRAEEVGREAADAILKQISSLAPADVYVADQLVPFLALFGGSIKCTEVSGHAMSNIHVVEKFTGKIFEVKGDTINVQ